MNLKKWTLFIFKIELTEMWCIKYFNITYLSDCLLSSSLDATYKVSLIKNCILSRQHFDIDKQEVFAFSEVSMIPQLLISFCFPHPVLSLVLFMLNAFVIFINRGSISHNKKWHAFHYWLKWDSTKRSNANKLCVFFP